nr:pyridoxal-phosphate dependent enzyme [Clostridia bacterium]
MNILTTLRTGEETAWVNPYRTPYTTAEPLSTLVIPDSMIDDAAARLKRFAPYIVKKFPETAQNGGLIESPLRDIPQMKAALTKAYGADIKGRLMLKMDSHLAIAGSIKARGGIYEVLKHAEDIAVAAGKLSYDDDYTKLDTDEMREFFGRYTMQVGSTGNLGMSIGIMSAAIGFKVKIHMSSD